MQSKVSRTLKGVLNKGVFGKVGTDYIEQKYTKVT